MADNNFKWYVLRAISGKENKVKEYIEGALVTSTLFKEYVSQVLIPTEKVVSLRGGKRVVKERNMLPGYVLVECNLTDECYPLLRNIPNVLGFLSESKSSIKPAPVSQAEINKIMGNVDEMAADTLMEETFLEHRIKRGISAMRTRSFRYSEPMTARLLLLDGGMDIVLFLICALNVIESSLARSFVIWLTITV